MNEQELILAAIQQIMQAAQKGDQNAQNVVQYIATVAQNIALNTTQGSNQQTNTLYVRQGAKLNYLKTLRGNCPEGTELQYYKAGGRLCKKCVKKHQGGGDSGDAIAEFRKERCGGKMKKKAVGGTVDLPAKPCKKHAVGGAVDAQPNKKLIKRKYKYGGE